MPLTVGDGSAAEQALARLKGTAGPATATTSGAPTSTRYQIPVKIGGYTLTKPVNQGQYDDDIHTTIDAKERQHKDTIDRYDLTDEGVNAAMGAWYQMDDGERGALAKKMWFLGLVKDPNDFDGAYTVWKKAVEHAARFALTGREIDPRDVLDMMGDAESGAGSVKNQGPVTRRQIDLTDPETARAWVDQAFQKSMGRAPEDAEVRALIDAIAAKERAHPTVQTTTPTQWDENGQPIDSTTTTTGGFNSQAFLANQISDDPEATAHQAAGELWPALMAALAAGG